jgi:hypothetical protein
MKLFCVTTNKINNGIFSIFNFAYPDQLSDSGYFSFDEWLFKSKATLTPFIQPISKLENFEDQILEKKNNFDNTKRETLVAVLQNNI